MKNIHPTLAYLYIHEIGRCFRQQQFTFTNDFSINYNHLHRKLSLTKNRTNPYAGLWGGHISNINLIVGKNGSGKSTVLDLLGMKQYQRNHFFEHAQWFAIYHLEDDTFVIEGRNPGLLENVARALPEGVADYSVRISFSYERQQITVHGNTAGEFHDDRRTAENERLIYLYQLKAPTRSWLRQVKDIGAQDTFTGYQRVYLDNTLFAGIYKFMSAEYKKLENVFTIDRAVCEFRRRDKIFPDFTTEEDKLEMLGFRFYQGKGNVLFFESDKVPILPKRKRNPSPWSLKDKFIISYLEAAVMDLWINSLLSDLSKEEKQEYIARIHEIAYDTDDYSTRIKYLFNLLDLLGEWLLPKLQEKEGINFDPNIYKAMKVAFEELEAIYYISGAEVVVRVSTGMDDAVHGLLLIYDRFINKYGLRRSLDVSFRYMSSGELEFIHSFVSVYGAIQVAVNHEQVDTILLLLDEPDASFHPEWSRRYIHYLTECIRLAELNEGIKFQVVIATHSPFIVSDVPKEHITCINVTQDLMRIVKKADFGLMGNFYDIVKNDFFLDSPVGEFAKGLFKRIMGRIKEWREYDGEEIELVRGLISAIDEPVIRSRLQERLEGRVAELAVRQKVFESQMELEDKIARMEKELAALKKRRERTLD
nr:AAA family ATPase [Paenibacillus contaminans]